MWTSTLDLDPKRVLITQLLRRVWPDVSFSSLAPLQVQNLPRQSLPEKTWVRVRNRLAGICGSDLHLIQGDGDFRIVPAALSLHTHSYPGHEVVGEVLEVGEDVQRIRVGDHVVLQYGPNCLSSGVQSPCRSCAQGYYNLCEYGKLPGPSPIGGGWSEEMLLPEQQLFRLPTDVSDEQAVLLEPTAVAVHAALRHPPQQNERILIIGAGAIGLLTLQVVHALAPQAEISVLARHSFQVEQATRMGATHIIYPQDSYSGIQRATGAHLYEGMMGNRTLLGGYDTIFDTVGNQKTLHDALRWAQAQATVVLIGVHLHPMHIDLTPVWYQEINLIGSVGSSVENWPPATKERRSTFEVALELMQRGLIHPELLITHRFPLNNYRTALLTAAGKAQNHAIKVVFDYSLLPPSVVPNVRASAVRKRRPSIPIDENASISETETTPEGTSAPAQPAEPTIQTASLSPLFSSSQTVAPLHEDDEFDGMEATISTPAIAKYRRQALAAQQMREELIKRAPTHHTPPSSNNEETASTSLAQSNAQADDIADEPEAEETHPTALIEQEHIFTTIDEVVSLAPSKQDILTEDVTLLEQETDREEAETATETSIVKQDMLTEDAALPEQDREEAETTDETFIIEQEDPSEEPITTDITLWNANKPAEVITDALLLSINETLATSMEIVEDKSEPAEIVVDTSQLSTKETPPTRFIETVEDSDETFQPSSMYEDVTEFSDAQTGDETFQPSSMYEDVAEYLDAQTIDIDQYNFEHSEQYTIEVPVDFAEEPTEFTTYEFPDPTTEIIPSPDLAIEEENNAGSGTDETENTLLHREGPPTTKAQVRPRSRTRKKSNRTSVEKR